MTNLISDFEYEHSIDTLTLLKSNYKYKRRSRLRKAQPLALQTAKGRKSARPQPSPLQPIPTANELGEGREMNEKKKQNDLRNQSIYKSTINSISIIPEMIFMQTVQIIMKHLVGAIAIVNQMAKESKQIKAKLLPKLQKTFIYIKNINSNKNSLQISKQETKCLWACRLLRHDFSFYLPIFLLIVLCKCQTSLSTLLASLSLLLLLLVISMKINHELWAKSLNSCWSRTSSVASNVEWQLSATPAALAATATAALSTSSSSFLFLLILILLTSMSSSVMSTAKHLLTIFKPSSSNTSSSRLHDHEDRHQSQIKAKRRCCSNQSLSLKYSNKCQELQDLCVNPMQTRVKSVMMAVFMGLMLMGSHQVDAGACWANTLSNGKCSKIFAMNTTKADCCRMNQQFSYTDHELTSVEFFFATAIGGGMECTPCIENCKNVKCGLNKKCVKRKGRPKCICAPECGAAKRRKAQLLKNSIKMQQQHSQLPELSHQFDQHPRQFYSNEYPQEGRGRGKLQRDIRSLSMEITNFNLGLDELTKLNYRHHQQKQQQQQQQQTDNVNESQREAEQLQQNKHSIFNNDKFILNEKPTIKRRFQVLSNIPAATHHQHHHHHQQQQQQQLHKRKKHQNKNHQQPEQRQRVNDHLPRNDLNRTNELTTSDIKSRSSVSRHSQETIDAVVSQSSEVHKQKQQQQINYHNEEESSKSNHNNENQHKQRHRKKQKQSAQQSTATTSTATATDQKKIETSKNENRNENKQNIERHRNNQYEINRNNQINNNNRRQHHKSPHQALHATTGKATTTSLPKENHQISGLDPDTTHSQTKAQVHTPNKQQQKQEVEAAAAAAAETHHQSNDNHKNYPLNKINQSNNIATSFASSSLAPTRFLSSASLSSSMPTSTTSSSSSSTAALSPRNDTQSISITHKSSTPSAVSISTPTLTSTSSLASSTSLFQLQANGNASLSSNANQKHQQQQQQQQQRPRLEKHQQQQQGKSGDLHSSFGFSALNARAKQQDKLPTAAHEPKHEETAFVDSLNEQYSLHGFPNQQYSLMNWDHFHGAHPVCGSDGRTYNTECQLKKRACRTNNPGLNIAYRGHCKTSCNGVKCLNGLTCVEDQYQIPHCITCNIQCPRDELNRDESRAVCGVDGKTYKSTCDINQMICKTGRAIAIAYPGPCRGDRVTCQDINCGPKNTCLVDLLTHEPRCLSCRYKCPRKKRPKSLRFEEGKICGVNNRTYNSWCELRKDSCSTGFLIDIKSPGPCSKN